MRQDNPSRRSWLDGEAFIAHRLELITSPAWRHRPKSLAKILERIEIEHLQHAGKQNGELIVTYTQLEQYGVSRKSISAMLTIGCGLGLIAISYPEKWMGDVRPPNLYRLCYVPTKDRSAPTDEWRFLSLEKVKSVLATRLHGDGFARHREVA